jgi:hypothetical protein
LLCCWSLLQRLLLLRWPYSPIDAAAFCFTLTPSTYFTHYALLQSKVFIYPRMFSIHDMTTDTGLPSDNADDECPTAGPNQVRLPSILNLSYERCVLRTCAAVSVIWSLLLLKWSTIAPACSFRSRPSETTY